MVVCGVGTLSFVIEDGDVVGGDSDVFLVGLFVAVEADEAFEGLEGGVLLEEGHRRVMMFQINYSIDLFIIHAMPYLTSINISLAGI